MRLIQEISLISFLSCQNMEDCWTTLSNRKFQGSLGYKSDPVSNKIKLVKMRVGI